MDLSKKNLLQQYSKEMGDELNAILGYWTKNTCDNVNGGFIGRIDESNVPHPEAPKGSVLNSRILWAFSSAYTITNKEEYLHVARVAYNYISNKFIDKTFGGVYWSLTATGEPLDTKKQIYALAFAIYGCSAYFIASKNEAAKNTAIELFNTIEQYSFDPLYTGYLDAFSRDWKEMDDIRLSAKDANEKKTMNTHLHILEAYTALYRSWPDPILRDKIVLLINNFTGHIIDATNYHQVLFFDEHWNRRSATVSYGHDIEAAWLLLEAAEVINDASLIAVVKALSVNITTAAAEGLDTDGGLWYEYEPAQEHFNKEKHSWVQAEAMIGFFNAWQLTKEEVFLRNSLQSWAYVKKYIRDEKYGEWFWGRRADGAVMPGQDKAGPWKCPYHNSRACIEIMHRVSKLKLD